MVIQAGPAFKFCRQLEVVEWPNEAADCVLPGVRIGKEFRWLWSVAAAAAAKPSDSSPPQDTQRTGQPIMQDTKAQCSQ